MAILQRFICSKHGEFDAWSGESVRCPAAKCRCKPRQQVCAPAIHTSGKTAHADRTLDQLAMDFRMTNIKSVKEGDSQSGYLTRNNQPAPKEERPGNAVMWGDKGRFALDNIVKSGAATSIHGEPVGIRPRDVGVHRPPVTSSYIADHENLRVKT